MKLLHKTTLYLLLAALPISLGGVFLLHSFIHRYIRHEIDELLASELIQVKEQLRQHPADAADLPGWDPNVRIRLTRLPLSAPSVYFDTTTFLPGEKEPEHIRILRTTYTFRNRNYEITLKQSYLEFDEIANALSVGVIVCFLVFVLLLIIADILVTRRIWHPFYGIIDQLHQYRIDGPDDATFPVSNVEEFTLLSQSLEEMSRRSRHQYVQQKQFTDHASHEMQTPLSVLSFELDLLQQSERLEEADLDRIQRAQQEIRRLSAMNQSLLLLAKIDNHQFAQNESVNIGELVTQLIDNYTDFGAHRGITITRVIHEKTYRLINRQLAEVLFSNLIKNAFRHGDANSPVFFQVSSTQFVVTNEGDPLPFPEDQIFGRFVRNQSQTQSTGLGLALVREIADQYGMRVHYTYVSGMRRHVLQVDL
ncbi:sensor histidine kinase [Spirosoma pomorum]